MFTNRYTIAVAAANGIANIGREAVRPRLIRRGCDARVSRHAIDRLEAVITAVLASDVDNPNGFGIKAAGDDA